MEILLSHISEWFLNKREHFAAFAQADSRIEGWFKAELLVLFNRPAKLRLKPTSGRIAYREK
ncbi:MAG: hypothetical protein KJZ86_18365, partial [Caldilineaceae bacterium]|nr:hypothetical protein [Caldilineaceae bacterium]HRJ41777.1 hypothetical protein [Caldilineaceae bacterium]